MISFPARHDSTELVHVASFYDCLEDYVAAVVPFVQEGLATGEPALVAVPAANLEVLRAELNGSGTQVDFADMEKLGRNPARIIPAVRAFTDEHPEQRTRFVGEPIWAGRSLPELSEAHRHEALLNLAFAHTPTTILCPYNVAALDPAVVADAERAHPRLAYGAAQRTCPRYVDPAELLVATEALAAVPDDAVSLEFSIGGLRGVRRFIGRFSTLAGLGERQVADLVMAVNEIATNTLVHAASGGTIRAWRTADDFACEISGGGCIADPLVGRVHPDDLELGGRGLWLVNQLCDLVELRSGTAGTLVRLHVGIARKPSP